jgi:hypothetical protein
MIVYLYQLFRGFSSEIVVFENLFGAICRMQTNMRGNSATPFGVDY